MDSEEEQDVREASAIVPDDDVTREEDEAHDLDDDDDFADFAQAAFPDIQNVTCGQEEEDNFADFADFQNATFPTVSATQSSECRLSDPVPEISSIPSATISPPACPLSKIDQKIRSAFILNHCDSDVAIGDEKISSISQSLAGNAIWHRLKKMSAMNSLNKFKWTNSHTFKSFTEALQVDPNIIPMRATATAVTSDSPPQKLVPQQPALSEHKDQGSSNQNGFVAPLSDPSPQQKDMSSISLDFLADQNVSSDRPLSSSSFSHLAPSCSKSVLQLEEELLSDLQVPADQESGNNGMKKVLEGDKILQTLLSNLSNASVTNTPSGPVSSLPLTHSNGYKMEATATAATSDKSNGRCKVLGMSAEAAQILDELPILSFLRSNLI